MPKEREMVSIDGFVIDATVSEGHEHPSAVTKYPVEKGGDVTDNIRPEPITITLECVVSDNPIGRVAVARGMVNDPDPVLSAFYGPPSDQAYAKMIKIREDREPVLVQTSLKDFPSMAMTNLSVPRKSGEPDALQFTVTFEQVLIVSNTRRAVTVAQGKTDLGHRAPAGKSIYPILWRVGNPAGSDNIIQFEFVLYAQKPNGVWTFFHTNTDQQKYVPTKLTNQRELNGNERPNFDKDLARDLAQTGRLALPGNPNTTNAVTKPAQPPKDPTKDLAALALGVLGH